MCFRAPLSGFEGGRQLLRVIAAEAADVAVGEPQLDGIEAGDVVETKAWPHADPEPVEPAVAHHLRGRDVGPRESVAQQSGSELPAELVRVTSMVNDEKSQARIANRIAAAQRAARTATTGCA